MCTRSPSPSAESVFGRVVRGLSGLHAAESGIPCVSLFIFDKSAAGYASESEATAAGKELYVDLTGFWGVSAEDGSALLLPITDDTMYRDPAIAEGQPEDYVSAKYLYETYLQAGAPYEGYAPGVRGA